MTKIIDSLEEKLEGQPLKSKIKDGIKAVPPILACTAGFYLLRFTYLTHIFQHLPFDEGTALAAGSGLYSGGINNPNRNATSLAALAASFLPDLITLVNGDLKQAGLSAGIKTASYGLGRSISNLFRSYK